MKNNGHLVDDITRSLILIVDDMPQNVQVLAGILKNEGFDCVPAMSGEQALSIARKRPPDLILLDIQMPGTDGFEVCRQLQSDEQTHSIPIIFLTARTETDDVVRGLKLGAVDYITKPFQQTELLMRVRNHLELKHARTRLQEHNEELEEKVRQRTIALQNAMENEREFKNLHSKFISIVSHQFRTPMTSILLNADLYLRSVQKGNPFPAEQVASMFSDTVAAVKRMMSMLDSNAKFLNIETLILTDPISEVDAVQLCRHTVESFRMDEAPSQNIRIATRSEEPVVVHAQPFVLEAALFELLKNAVQYSQPDSEILITVLKKGTSVQIRVTDQGRGIPEAELESIFELFRRGQQEEEIGKVPGLGIGLALARVCMQQVMKGSVWCESIQGEGATFILDIPLGLAVD